MLVKLEYISVEVEMIPTPQGYDYCENILNYYKYNRVRGKVVYYVDIISYLYKSPTFRLLTKELFEQIRKAFDICIRTQDADKFWSIMQLIYYKDTGNARDIIEECLLFANSSNLNEKEILLKEVTDLMNRVIDKVKSEFKGKFINYSDGYCIMAIDKGEEVPTSDLFEIGVLS